MGPDYKFLLIDVIVLAALGGLKREINRRLDVIDKIRKQFEPRLLNISGNLVYPKVSQSTVFRMKAVDELKNLENELEQIGIIQRRDPGKCVRAFLINLFNTTLWGPPQRLVHEFCDLYERARYSSDEFSEEHLVRYRSLMMKILEIARSHRTKGGRTVHHDTNIRFKSQPAT
ncbi:uncharacterized protein LOC136041195 isoform X2 [Artemia franciscana]|uniref:uncharacterized protein LOC136041195 isoform X2 n=1 Tax=Artemia franciscana TaxID=6661 RepID=UPI0032DADC98